MKVSKKLMYQCIHFCLQNSVKFTCHHLSDISNIFLSYTPKPRWKKYLKETTNRYRRKGELVPLKNVKFWACQWASASENRANYKRSMHNSAWIYVHINSLTWFFVLYQLLTPVIVIVIGQFCIKIGCLSFGYTHLSIFFWRILYKYLFVYTQFSWVLECFCTAFLHHICNLTNLVGD
jgi:hypothetical protein